MQYLFCASRLLIAKRSLGDDANDRNRVQMAAAGLSWREDDMSAFDQANWRISRR